MSETSAGAPVGVKLMSETSAGAPVPPADVSVGSACGAAPFGELSFTSFLTGYKQEYLKLLRLKGEVPVGRRGFTSEGTYVLQSYSLLM